MRDTTRVAWRGRGLSPLSSWEEDDPRGTGNEEVQLTSLDEDEGGLRVGPATTGVGKTGEDVVVVGPRHPEYWVYGKTRSRVKSSHENNPFAP